MFSKRLLRIKALHQLLTQVACARAVHARQGVGDCLAGVQCPAPELLGKSYENIKLVHASYCQLFGWWRQIQAARLRTGARLPEGASLQTYSLLPLLEKKVKQHELARRYPAIWEDRLVEESYDAYIASLTPAAEGLLENPEKRDARGEGGGAGNPGATPPGDQPDPAWQQLKHMATFAYHHRRLQDGASFADLEWNEHKWLTHRLLMKSLKQLAAGHPDAFSIYIAAPTPLERGMMDALLTGVSREAAHHSALFADMIPNWELDRLYLLDDLLLRLALAELAAPSAPPYPLLLTEYMEIANIYSHPDSARFLNGVLEAIWKKGLLPGVQAAE